MNKYRVIVERIGDEKDETLFEIVGSAVLVARMVPAALLDVLSGDPEAQGGSVADRVLDAALTAGGERPDGVLRSADAEPVKQTRNRRSKAQIAADKEAEGLGFRDAAHRAEVEAQQAGQPTTDAPPSPTAAGQVDPSTGNQVTAPLSQAVAIETPAPGGGAPYNPFIQPTH